MIPSSCLFFKVGADVFFNVFFGLAIEGRMGYTTWELFFSFIVIISCSCIPYQVFSRCIPFSLHSAGFYEWSVCLYP